MHLKVLNRFPDFQHWRITMIHDNIDDNVLFKLYIAYNYCFYGLQSQEIMNPITAQF